MGDAIKETHSSHHSHHSHHSSHHSHHHSSGKRHHSSEQRRNINRQKKLHRQRVWKNIKRTLFIVLFVLAIVAVIYILNNPDISLGF